MSDRENATDGSLVPAGRRDLAILPGVNPLISRAIADLARSPLLKMCEAALVDLKSEALSCYLRGMDRLEKDDYHNAIKDFDDAIQLDPKYALAYYSRGEAWMCNADHDKALADFDEAIRLFDEAIRFDGRNPLLFLNRGKAWMTREAVCSGDDESEFSIRDFDETIRLDSSCALAYYNRYLATRSERDLNQAIRLSPDNACWYDHRGQNRYLDKQYDNAIKDFDEAIRLDPDRAHSYWHRGKTKK